jgi:hypothetical protein
MGMTIHKVLLFLKRNPAMTMDAFIEAYETVHVPFCMPYMDAACRRHIRRYVTLVGAPHDAAPELDFDCITELWYEDEAAADAVAAKVSHHRLPDEVLPYEDRMFDRPKIRVARVAEYVTEIGEWASQPDERAVA